MIVIYGATGLAGELIARELCERGVTLVLAGRDRGRLLELAASLPTEPEVRVAHVHDASALREACDGARVVIGCAAPFARVGSAVLEAAIKSGAHYVDICGEQPFLRETYEAYEAAAHRAGVVCVSGLGFRIALGDWAAALAHQNLSSGDGADDPGDERQLDELSISYALAKPHLTARERAMAASLLSSPTLIWERDRWQTMAPGAQRRRVGFGEKFGEQEAVLFGGGEVITVPRHIEARTIKTYLWIETKNPLLWEATRIAPLLSPLLGPLVTGPLGRFVRAQADAMSEPVGARERAETEFVLVATATRGFDSSRVVLRGHDPYRLTAEICSAGALALAKRPHAGGGFLAPAQVFDPRARLYSLAARELIEVEES